MRKLMWTIVETGAIKIQARRKRRRRRRRNTVRKLEIVGIIVKQNRGRGVKKTLDNVFHRGNKSEKGNAVYLLRLLCYNLIHVSQQLMFISVEIGILSLNAQLVERCS